MEGTLPKEASQNADTRASQNTDTRAPNSFARHPVKAKSPAEPGSCSFFLPLQQFT